MVTPRQQGQEKQKPTTMHFKDGMLKIGIPVGSIATALFALAGSYIGDLQSTASASLEIIHQHTRDLQRLDNKIGQVQLVTNDLKAKADIGGRFTEKQGRALQKRVRDLEKQHIVLLRDQNKLFEILYKQGRTNINLRMNDENANLD